MVRTLCVTAALLFQNVHPSLLDDKLVDLVDGLACVLVRACRVDQLGSMNLEQDQQGHEVCVCDPE